MATEIEKREKFKKIAGNRTNRIIDDLHLLGNCSNRSNYEYSEEDVKKIFSAIEAALKESKQKFYAKKDRKQRFEL